MNIKKIDCHVHTRDDGEAYKETVKGVSRKAAEQGIIAICGMPNTVPPILRRKDIERRLSLIQEEKPLVKNFLFVGITLDKKQIKEAALAVRKFPEVVGIKLYAGPTTNALGVNNEEDQRMIYQTLSELNYTGVIAVHCEKESELKTELWDPKKPWTHGKARPIRAEVEAVKDQIRFAKEANFSGHLHICHISLVQALEIIQETQDKGSVNTSAEVTPHHLLLDERVMHGEWQNGLMFKVNPPLRPREEAERLREKVISLIKEGANWLCIATDYAPHAPEERLKPPYPSGIADYSLYGQLLDIMNEEGLSWREIEMLTYRNVKEIFNGKFVGI